MKPLLQKAFKYETIWAAGNVSRKRGYEKNYGTWWEISAHKSG
jgi:mannose-6-phosphate isomerase